ncbi:MAG: hypothetical protein F9K32_14305 [Desulfobulbaceae bacterium]|nr:MAG: hypothetical protein F9K32_14305 [Desulfobulbaceae bacterium]
MAFILVLCSVFCLLPDRASVLAAASQPPADAAAVLYLSADAGSSGDPQLSREPAEMQQQGMTDVLSEGTDGEDELSVKHSASFSPTGEASGKAGEISGTVESLRGKPPIPPPDPESRTITVNDHILLAKNTTATAKDAGKGKTEPAPEPKTSKSSSVSTPLLAGAGIAIIAGAVAAAGGGSDSDASGPSTPTSPSGDTSSGSSEVINLSSLVRIGDDNDYNGNHPDKFKQNRPTGISWTDSFNISNANNISSATFKYTVAASKVANPVYINGKLAGKLCNPGNTAWNVESCSIGITGLIRSGTNEIKIKCAIDESDTDTPYDDVELYNLRIELTR